MSKERLLSVLDESESLNNVKIGKISEGFNKQRFFKLKIKEIRKNLYEIGNKNIAESKTKDNEKNIFELEESLSKLIKYHDYDDTEYKGIRNVENLFSHSTDENYYKSIKTKSAFNSNYCKYESNGDKDKNLSVKEYVCMIRPYLNDVINNHKITKNLKVHSRNVVFDYKTQFGEWKIQITMSINFIS